MPHALAAVSLLLCGARAGAVASTKVEYLAYPTEGGVVVLGSANFADFIAEQEYTIVEFYAPWCGHCKTLEPEWSAAAKKVSKLNPKVYLAKVDADTHKDLAEKYGVSGYPTLKIFKSGEAEEYNGPREAKGIVKFVKDAIGLSGGGALTKLQSVDEAKALVDGRGGGYVLLGLFRDPVSASSMFKVFAEVASEFSESTEPKISAAYSSSYTKDPIAEALGVKTVPAVLLYSPGGGEPASLPIPRDRKQFTEELVTEWLQKQLK